MAHSGEAPETGSCCAASEAAFFQDGRLLAEIDEGPLEERASPSRSLLAACAALSLNAANGAEEAQASAAETRPSSPCAASAGDASPLLDEGLFVAETVARMLAEASCGASSDSEERSSARASAGGLEAELSSRLSLSLSGQPLSRTRFSRRALPVLAPAAEASITACAVASEALFFVLGFDSGELLLSAFPDGDSPATAGGDFQASGSASPAHWARRLQGLCPDEDEEGAAEGESVDTKVSSREAEAFWLHGHQKAVTDLCIEGSLVASSSESGCVLLHLNPLGDASSLRPAAFPESGGVALPLVCPLFSLTFAASVRCVCLAPSFSSSRLLASALPSASPLSPPRPLPPTSAASQGGRSAPAEKKPPGSEAVFDAQNSSRLKLASAAAVEAVLCAGCDDGRLLLRCQGLFMERDAILHAGEGPVGCVRWRGSLLGWTAGDGTRVFDLHSQQKVAFFARPSAGLQGDGAAAKAQQRLEWLSDSLLAVAWPSHVQVVQVVEHAVGGGAGLAGEEEEPFLSLKVGRLVAVVDTTPDFLWGFSVADEEVVRAELQPALCLLTSSSQGAGGGDSESEAPQIRVGIYSTRSGEWLHSQALENSGEEAAVCRQAVLPWSDAEWAAFLLKASEASVWSQEEKALLQDTLRRVERRDPSAPRVFESKVRVALLLLQNNRSEEAVRLLQSLRLRSREAWKAAVFFFDEWKALPFLVDKVVESLSAAEEEGTPPETSAELPDDSVKLLMAKRLLQRTWPRQGGKDAAEAKNAGEEEAPSEEKEEEKNEETRGRPTPRAALPLESARALSRSLNCRSFLSETSRREFVAAFLAHPALQRDAAWPDFASEKDGNESGVAASCEAEKELRRVLLSAAARLAHSQRLYTWAVRCLLSLESPHVAAYIRCVLCSCCDCPCDVLNPVPTPEGASVVDGGASCLVCREARGEGRGLRAKKEAAQELLGAVPRLAPEILARGAESAFALLCQRVASSPPWLSQPQPLKCFCVLRFSESLPRCAVCVLGVSKSRGALLFPPELVAVELHKRRLRLLLHEYLKAARAVCPVATESLALLQVELFRSLEPQGLLSFLRLADGVYDCRAVLSLIEGSRAPEAQVSVEERGLAGEEEKQRKFFLAKHAASQLLQPNRVRAFLLERLGRRREALVFLVRKCHDVEAAVQLVERAEANACVALSENQGKDRGGSEASVTDLFEEEEDDASPEGLWSALVKLCLDKPSLTAALLRALDEPCCADGSAEKRPSSSPAKDEGTFILENCKHAFKRGQQTARAAPPRWSLLPLSLAQELLQILPSRRLKNLLPAVERRVAILLKYQRDLQKLIRAACVCAEAEAQEMRSEIFERRRRAVVLDVLAEKEETDGASSTCALNAEAEAARPFFSAADWGAPLGLPRWSTAVPLAASEETLQRRRALQGAAQRRLLDFSASTLTPADSARRPGTRGLRGRRRSRATCCAICHGGLASPPAVPPLWRGLCETGGGEEGCAARGRVVQSQDGAKAEREASIARVGNSNSEGLSLSFAAAATDSAVSPPSSASLSEQRVESSWEGVSMGVFAQKREAPEKPTPEERPGEGGGEGVVVLWCGHCMHTQCCRLSLLAPSDKASRESASRGASADPDGGSSPLQKWQSPSEELREAGAAATEWIPRCVLCLASASSGWRGEWGGFCGDTQTNAPSADAAAAAAKAEECRRALQREEGLVL